MKSILFAAASLLALSSLVGCAETASYGRMERDAQIRDRMTTAELRPPSVLEDTTGRTGTVTHFSEASRSVDARGH